MALSVLTLFVGLGVPAISDSDEAFYAESGREMIESGDWITPHFNYEPRFQKPILFYWMVAASYRVAGVGEAPARWFAAMSGLGLALVAYACGRRWYGRAPGLIAGAVVATCFGTFIMARQSLPDLPTALFITVGTWAAIEAVGRAGTASQRDDPLKGSPNRRAWLVLSAAAMALGMLAKGPIAVVIPLGVVCAVILWERWAERTPGGAFRVSTRAVDVLLAIGVFAIIAAPWYVAVTRVHGTPYLYGFFVGENLQRFTTSTYNEPRTVWYYVPVVVGGLLPWSAFLALWVSPLLRVLRGRRNLTLTEARLGVWALVPFVLLSASIGKQPRYVLPCLVPLAVLLGNTIWRRIQQPATRGRDIGIRVACALTGGVVLAVGVLILRAGPIFAAVAAHWSAAIPAVIAAAGVVAIVSAAAFPLRRVVLILVVAAAVMLVGVQQSVLALGQPEPVQIAARAAQAEGVVSSICTCGAFARNLVFYARARTLFGAGPDAVRRILEMPEPVVAVVDARVLDAIEAETGRSFRRLATMKYLNAGQLRLRTFFDPKPERDLQVVVFVSNR